MGWVRPRTLRPGWSGEYPQIRKGLQSILRGLSRNNVADTVLWIEPVRRAGLKISAGRDQQAAGDIPLRQTNVLRPGAVHVDQKCGLLKGC